MQNFKTNTKGSNRALSLALGLSIHVALAVAFLVGTPAKAQASDLYTTMQLVQLLGAQKDMGRSKYTQEQRIQVYKSLKAVGDTYRKLDTPTYGPPTPRAPIQPNHYYGCDPLRNPYCNR